MNNKYTLAALMALCVFPLLSGDLTIVYSSKTKGMLGMNAEGVQTSYYTATHHKTEDQGAKQDTLVDFGKEHFYTIKHKEKLIEKMTFEDMVAMAELAKKKLEGVAEMPDFVKKMMGGGAAEAKVEAQGEETVIGRKCRKFKITIGKMNQEVCMDERLKVPVNPNAYARFIKLKSYAVPGGGNMAKLQEEFSKLKGMALRVRVSGFMGMDSVQEATKVSDAPVPASIFALPAGYKMEDVGKKMRQEMQEK